MVTLLPRIHQQPANNSLEFGQNGEFKPLVMVVEDHDDTRSLLRYLLENLSYRVAEVTNGEQAVREAEKTCPDLILIDIELPDLDGISAACQIRQIANLRNVPIVFLSGYAETKIHSVAVAAGANDYLVKPFDVAQLGNTVAKHIKPKNNSHAAFGGLW